jgi:hypothetical protein
LPCTATRNVPPGRVYPTFLSVAWC